MLKTIPESVGTAKRKKHMLQDMNLLVLLVLE